MVSIGITGGVGSGKSEVLSYMEKEYGAVIILADKVAHLLEAKGQSCYNKLVKAFGEGILDSEGEIDKKRFASVIFADEKNLKIVNDIIHPAVKQYILEKMDESNKAGEKLFVLEAALLIEEGYDKILDEIWYIHSDEKKRYEWLKNSRGYSKEKTAGIINSQLNEKMFRDNSDRIIENDGEIIDLHQKIKAAVDEVMGY